MGVVRVVGAGALALFAALRPGDAWAGKDPPRGLGVPAIADYNAALVKSAGGVVAVPAGLATYTVNQGMLEVNSRLTVTLPAAFTFGSPLALTSNQATAFALASGGVNCRSATFTVTASPLRPGGAVTLGAFSVQGATALETPIVPADALPISLQSTNNSESANDDPLPLSAGAFAAEPGTVAFFSGASNQIDLTPPSFGSAFVNVLGGAAPDNMTTLLSTITVLPEAMEPTTGVLVRQPEGGPNAFPVTDSAIVTVTGRFNGIASAFAALATEPLCRDAISTGTVTPTTVTIPNVPIGPGVVLCVTANGTALLEQNPPTPDLDTTAAFTLVVAPGNGTDFLGARVLDQFGGDWRYTGGGVVPVANFFTGDDAGYRSLLRVSNGGRDPVMLFALVQPDTGGSPLVGLLGGLAAGTGTVFTVPEILNDVAGLSLTNSGQRAVLRLVITGDFGNVSASGLLINPNGAVTNVGAWPSVPAR